MLRLLTMNSTPLEDDWVFAEAYASLSPFRQEKIDRYRFRRDKNLSLGAGLLLDCALKEFSLREREMQYGLGENEKPYFVSAPELQFNLSHSHTQVLAALSDSPVGCDIEQVKPVDLKLAKRFFHEEEYAAILCAPNEQERQRLFFRFWTLKESYMKCTGAGFRMPLDSFCIRLLDPPEIVGEKVFFKEYDIPGYCAALCTKNHTPMPELTQINIECG